MYMYTYIRIRMKRGRPRDCFVDFLAMQVNTLFLVSCWLCLAAHVSLLEAETSSDWDLFDSFMTNFSKTYRSNTETLQYKFQAFQQSLERHRVLNAFEAKHGGSAVYGINKFSDLTPEEFRRDHLSDLHPILGGGNKHKKFDLGSLKDVPEKFDWREKNVIGPILDQQRCGSCWAFAVVESIASKLAIDGGKLYQLSSQQLISCDYKPARNLDGCKGGTIQDALSTIKEEGMVIVLEKTYPFASENGDTLDCRPNLPNVGVMVTGYKFNMTITSDEMMRDLYNIGPLTTSVNALSWQDYIGGIIQHHCNNVFYDHAIQIVGYDTTNTVPYWIIRNTWGTDWGEKGYVRIKLGDNMCGLRDQVASVVGVKAVNL